MKHWNVAILVWVISLTGVQLYSFQGENATASDLDRFEEAAKLYNLEKYEESAAIYERILRSGRHSANLYFNLGNTHYKMGNIGPSIFYYEKALLLEPGDREIQQNLKFAEQMKIDDIEVLPETFSQRVGSVLLGSFHYDTWAILAVVFSALLSGFYVVYFLSSESRQKRLFFTLGVVASFLFVLSLLASVGGYRRYVNEQPAIIFNERVALTSAPNNRSEILFELHEGTKVYVLDELDEWTRVRLQNGQTGWMPLESIMRLKGSEIPTWSPTNR